MPTFIKPLFHAVFALELNNVVVHIEAFLFAIIDVRPSGININELLTFNSASEWLEVLQSCSLWKFIEESMMFN